MSKLVLFQTTVVFILLLSVVEGFQSSFTTWSTNKVEQLRNSLGPFHSQLSFVTLSNHISFLQTLQYSYPNSFTSSRRRSSVLFEKSSPSDGNEDNNNDESDNIDSSSGEVGSGPNWIERSFPVTLGADEEGTAAQLKKVEDYNLGISGISFQTGPLSQRMYEAIISNNNNQFPDDSLPDDIKQAFTMYAMDFTAKEATKAALNQNGLEMVLTEDEEDAGMWGDVDTIRLLDESTNLPIVGGQIYDSIQDAIIDWTPGQSFNFVVRQVPARIRKLTLDELRDALNTPDEGEFD